MQSVYVTVVVPTLAGDRRVLECLASLDSQTQRGVQVVVVDNSGCGRMRSLGAEKYEFQLIDNRENVGFGAAVNQGFRLAPAPYLATLNDDAVAEPRWLETLVTAMEKDPGAGMAASLILMAESGAVDSAGMLVARDGSSRQRGHGDSPSAWKESGEALLPSGCAALYRREMLGEVGLFEDDFFLYCEDTDLGLRGRRAGWKCLYEAGAVVRHHYSQSAGRASERKAWFVERNRMRVAVRCFPLSWLLANPFYAAVRYLWHVMSMIRGEGKAAEFRQGGGGSLRLPWIVVKAHLNLLRRLPALMGQRSRIASCSRISTDEFVALLRRHSISLRQVASL